MNTYTATFETHCKDKPHRPKYSGKVVTRKSKRVYAAAWRVIGSLGGDTWEVIYQGFSKDDSSAKKSAESALSSTIKHGVPGKAYRIENAVLESK